MSEDGRSRRRSTSPWLALAFVLVGLFGATVAVSGLWAPLPPPKAGGTCGPGLGSEAALEALVNPGSIGAGAEPPATRPAARAQWSEFVDECQAAANDRAVITIPTLIGSLVARRLWPGAAVEEGRASHPADASGDGSAVVDSPA